MANCGNTSVGYTPIPDFAVSEVYETFKGFLYPGETNTIPAPHLLLGMTAAANTKKRNAAGTPNAAGKLVLLGLGMSNANLKFAALRTIAASKGPGVVLVNGAQVGKDAVEMATDAAAYYSVVETRLTAQGVTPEQVGWIWLETAISAETGAFPGHAEDLQALFVTILGDIATEYPNCQGVSISPRTYGGYASGPTSPEPWAYEMGFAIKWLIESQIDESVPAVAYGTVPWLVWGPYLWADGETPNDAGLFWECDDFGSDGTHPSDAGALKAAELILTHFETSEFTTWWAGIETAVIASADSDADADNYDTDASYTPDANALQVVYVHSRFTDVPNVPTLTGHGLTYIEVETQLYAASNRSRLSVFRAYGSAPTAGFLSADFDGQTQTCCIIQVIQVSGAAASSPIVQKVKGAGAGISSLQLDLNPTPSIANTFMLAGFCNISGVGFTPRTDWLELADLDTTAQASRLQTQSRDDYEDTASASLSAGGTTSIAGIALEIRPEVAIVPNPAGVIYVLEADNVVKVPRSKNAVSVATADNLIFVEART